MNGHGHLACTAIVSESSVDDADRTGQRRQTELYVSKDMLRFGKACKLWVASARGNEARRTFKTRLTLYSETFAYSVKRR